MNVLFITATRVGDAVLSTGLLDHILKTYPNSRITLVCGPSAAGVFEAAPRIKKLIVLDKMLLSLHWIRMWVLCVPIIWDLIIDLRNAPISYFLLAFKQQHLGRLKSNKHRVKELAGILDLHENPPSPRMWPLPKHRAVARNLIPDGSSVLAIAPTANWEAKTWEPYKFVDLINRIGAKNGLLPNCRVAIFGRDDERSKAIRIIESVPVDRRLDFVGGLTLLEIYACFERCDLYIGNDSGLMHLAAASGVPTLGLFGPSKELLYAPWGEKCLSVRTVENFENIHPEKIIYED